MEINRLVIIILILFSCLSQSVFSEEETGGLQLTYLESGMGGVPSGMGGAFTAIADDGNAPFYNPAGLPRINKKLLTLNYQNSFIGSANFIYLSYVGIIKENKQGLGFSFIWDGIADLPSYTTEQKSGPSYSFTQIQAGISYGLRLLPRFYTGISGKFFYYNIATYSANNFDSDIGLFYNLLRNVNIGILFQNFLPLSYRLYSKEESIPFTVRSGIAFQIPGLNLMLSYEMEKQVEPSFDATPFYHHAGLRYNLFRMINLTGGYNKGDITLGLQIAIDKFTFFTGTARNEQGGKLSFSASYEFQDQPKADIEMEYFYEGISAYQNKDYRSAVKYFEQVLEMRDNPTAEFYLKNSKAYLESEAWMSKEDQALVGMKYELAKKYISQELYGKAISTLREVLEIDPSNEEARNLVTQVKNRVKQDVDKYYQNALSLFKSNKMEESLKECENSLALDPEHKPTLELKAKNEELLKDILAKRTKDEQVDAEAEALFQQGLENYQNENWIEAVNNFKKSYDLKKNEEAKTYLEKTRKKLEDAKITAQHKKESDNHLKLGIGLYEKGQLQESISEFEKALNIYPQNSEAQKYLTEARGKYDAIVSEPLEEGKKALREGRLADAILQFSKVLEIDKNNAVAKRFLSKAQSLIKDYVNSNLKLANKEYQAENYVKALEYYREVLKLDSDNQPAGKGEKDSRMKLDSTIKQYFNKGVEYFDKNEMKKSITEFEKALDLDPEYTPAKNFLTKARKKYEENKQAYQIQEYWQNGQDLFQNRNFEKAKGFFEKVLESEPNNMKASEYIERCNKELAVLQKQEQIAKIIADGMIFYRRRKYSDAIEVWQKVKEVDPENKLIDEYISYAKRAQEESLNKYYNDGTKYFQEGDLLRAKESLEKALEANPRHQKAKRKLAEVKAAIYQRVMQTQKAGKEEFKKGNYDEAAEQFENVLQYEKDNDEIEDYLRMSQEAKSAMIQGKDLFKQKKYSEAMEKFNFVMDLNKDDSKAKQAYNQVLAEGKKQLSTWYNEGIDFYNKGALKSAYLRFKSVVETDPTHQEGKKMLDKVDTEIEKKCSSLYKSGLSYYESKDYKKAIDQFNDIMELRNNYKDARLILAKAQKNYDQLTAKERKVASEKIQVRLYAGIKLYRDGKLNEAIREWEKVLAVDPGNAKATKYINRARYKIKQLEKLK
ncbi:MAG: tetratricopeptide repeat protein [Spirochaetes bacterium]|nr:tetratricopeptide repeat protein [Spirochaetota bacterium]